MCIKNMIYFIKNSQKWPKMAKKGQKWPILRVFFTKNRKKIQKIVKMGGYGGGIPKTTRGKLIDFDARWKIGRDDF